MKPQTSNLRLRYQIGIKIILVMIFVMPVSLLGFAQNAVELYVSSSGNDNNNGTKVKPFRSFDGIQRYLSKLTSKSDIRIYLREGTYHLSNTFQLTDKSYPLGSSILISSYNGEVATVSGGQHLENDKFKLVTEKSIVDRLSLQAKGKVYQYDLNDLDNKDFGVIRPNGFGRKKTASSLELFSNSEPMTNSRWPNDGNLLSIKSVSKTDSGIISGDKKNKAYPIFEYASDKKTNWKGYF